MIYHYSKMSQIETTVIKQGTKSANVISGSFFSMKDAYRPLSAYEGSLTHFFKLCVVMTGFEVRIYTDNSGKDIVLKLSEKYPNVSVILFDCPDFREDVGHKGTFGTLVRFLPLFEAGLKTVWISDIDIVANFLDETILKKFNDSKAEFRFRTVICYDQKVYGRHWTILAGTMISKITFPRQILTKFLNKLKDGGLSKIVDDLNDASKDRRPNSEIPYGIDEVFTNSVMYEYLIRHNIKCLIQKDFQSGSYYYLRYQGHISKQEIILFERYYAKNESFLIPRMKKILERDLPKAIEDRPCLKELYDTLDSFKTSFLKYYVVQGKELE